MVNDGLTAINDTHRAARPGQLVAAARTVPPELGWMWVRRLGGFGTRRRVTTNLPFCRFQRHWRPLSTFISGRGGRNQCRDSRQQMDH